MHSKCVQEVQENIPPIAREVAFAPPSAVLEPHLSAHQSYKRAIILTLLISQNVQQFKKIFQLKKQDH